MSASPAPSHANPELEIRQFLEENAGRLLLSLHFFVLRAKIGTGEAAWDIANELLNELVVEALNNIGRFDPDKSCYAWLLGIAANLIKRRQASQQRHSYREPLAHDLLTPGDTVTTEELFDWLGRLKRDDGPETRLVEQEAATEILNSLAANDREIIRLAVLVGLSGEDLAKRLGISPAAARVRLHRALQRLRANWTSPQPKTDQPGTEIDQAASYRKETQQKEFL